MFLAMIGLMLNRLALPLATLALAFSTSACIIAADDGSLTVANDSDYFIDELYVAPVDTVSWGRNLLGGDFLAPGEEITIGVDCDYYDARLIDEDGVECRVYDLDLCLNDAVWVIDNNTCSVFAVNKQGETVTTHGEIIGAHAEQAAK
jgi:ABC-type amino acid transport substrate-binding protein